MLNAGKYKNKIKIGRVENKKDGSGFNEKTTTYFLETYAEVKTIKGYTLIVNNTDFEKAYINFTIRKPRKEITKGMVVLFKGKTFEIQYANEINFDGIELELQTMEVDK